MNRIKVLDEALWPKVPKEVIHEAEQAAKSEPSWIVMQGNGHMVLMDPQAGRTLRPAIWSS